MDRTGLELSFLSLRKQERSSHGHLDNIHGSGASLLRVPVYSQPSIYDAAVLWTITERHGERIFLELRRRDAHSSDQGHSQVTFKVVAGTEPTLSVPMLVANGHRLVYRGEDTMLSTAAGEIVPLTSDGDDWYLKVLINKWKRVRTDWRVGRMSRVPSELGSLLEPGAWKGQPRQSQQPPPRHAKVFEM